MIHIAIVSHGHEDLLISSEIGGLQDAGDNIHVWIKDNEPSARLKEDMRGEKTRQDKREAGWLPCLSFVSVLA